MAEVIREPEHAREETRADLRRALADLAIECLGLLDDEHPQRRAAPFQQQRRRRAGERTADDHHIIARRHYPHLAMRPAESTRARGIFSRKKVVARLR